MHPPVLLWSDHSKACCKTEIHQFFSLFSTFAKKTRGGLLPAFSCLKLRGGDPELVCFTVVNAYYFLRVRIKGSLIISGRGHHIFLPSLSLYLFLGYFLFFKTKSPDSPIPYPVLRILLTLSLLFS